MKQIWHDLLFAHWPLPPAVMRPLIPEQLSLDRFDGYCWVGVVPFHMSGIRRRGLPALPGLSRFPELNVRTYVIYGGKPGVYFFSLDAANLPAVRAARTFYHLPYFHAAMDFEDRDGNIHYSLFFAPRPCVGRVPRNLSPNIGGTTARQGVDRTLAD